MEQQKLIRGLFSFLDASPTAWHAHDQLSELFLREMNSPVLSERDRWTFASGKSFSVSRNGSTLAAVKPGSLPLWETGIAIVGTHLDSPALKLKPLSFKRNRDMDATAVELYGSPILYSWFDRDLVLAGKAVSRIDGRSVLFRIDDHPVVIPSLGIHLQRDVNSSFSPNPHTHLRPVTSCPGGMSFILSRHLESLGLQDYDVDCFLVNPESAHLVGGDRMMYASGRIDNLSLTHAAAQALCDVPAAEHTSMAYFSDHEEIGSRTYSGADSSFLPSVIERLVSASGGGREEYFMTLARSFLVSADSAHAFHPNYPEKMDEGYAPVLNGGIVIKRSSAMRYTTTSQTAARIVSLCREQGIPCQELVNRADTPPGSTIGTMTSAENGIPAVDIGQPVLGMHSFRELAGVVDHEHAYNVLSAFFRSSPA